MSNSMTTAAAVADHEMIPMSKSVFDLLDTAAFQLNVQVRTLVFGPPKMTPVGEVSELIDDDGEA